MTFHQLITHFTWEQARTIAQTIQALVLSSVPFAAGYWFFKKRKFYPRANLKHQVIHKFLDNGELLIRVVVEIVNQGDVSIDLKKSEVLVQWVLPLRDHIREQINHAVKNHKKDVLWPTIGEKEVMIKRLIESGESDYEYFDIIINSKYREVKTILITTIFDKSSVKSKNQDQVWRLSTFHDLPDIDKENEQ